MTALAGLVRFERGGASDPSDGLLLERMLERMLDGPPDERRVLASSGASFARGRRLAGLRAVASTAEAPTIRAAPDVLVIADARIDRLEGVDAELAHARHGDESVDEAAIRLAYERWGEDCARHLRGDFAFALFDARQRRLLFACDPLAARQLVVHRDARGVRFASEEWALFADPTLRPEPNLEALARALDWLSTDDRATLYRGVELLAPGHTLVVDAKGSRLFPNWTAPLRVRDAREGDEALAARLAVALTAATSARIRRATGVGVTLSGGLDSSSVACVAEHERRRLGAPARPVVALHFGYGDLDCDETRFSRAVVERWSLESLEVDALGLGEATSLARASRPGMPLYYPGAYAFDVLFEAAATRGLDTILTGEGGDLLLSSTPFDHAEPFARGEVLRTLRRLVKPPTSPAAWRRAAHHTVQQLIPWSLRAKLRPFRRLSPSPVLTPRWHAAVEAQRLERELYWEAQPLDDRRARTMLQGLHESGQQRGVATLSYFARRRGVALAHPFLDGELVAWLATVPLEQRHAPLQRKPKPILRRALRELLPARVYRRTDSAEYSSFNRASLVGRDRPAVPRPTRLLALGLVRPDLEWCPSSEDRQAQRRMLKVAAVEAWLRQLEP